MSGPRPTATDPRPAPHPGRHPSPHATRSHAPDTAGDVVRWAAFSCVLVPVVLLCFGGSPAGAVGTALGLAAVTAACRFLLRRSERGATTRGGGRHTRGSTPVD
ncbi:hypothetical protein [Streptomyces fuscichromogenes]|uniref:Uncharacterized protein n=1 Tax=Streptomyces fuscichromogenes TaxID=1324013 RepID=A0A917UGU2_9ACTN|nr:hypothetical protein [Streptomyces fuscichromogenes]GGM91426.1 hypothetical protein GCM10011578_009220 [Streptomyces fuscichromogenes]